MISESLFVLTLIIWRFLVAVMDHRRVEQFLRQHRDGQLLQKRWAPFGPGWFEGMFFSSHFRIYRIVYRDRKERVHDGYVKTSMCIEVKVTFDRIIADPTRSSLEEERDHRRQLIAVREQERDRDPEV